MRVAWNRLRRRSAMGGSSRSAAHVLARVPEVPCFCDRGIPVRGRATYCVQYNRAIAWCELGVLWSRPVDWPGVLGAPHCLTRCCPVSDCHQRQMPGHWELMSNQEGKHCGTPHTPQWQESVPPLQRRLDWPDDDGGGSWQGRKLLNGPHVRIAQYGLCLMRSVVNGAQSNTKGAVDRGGRTFHSPHWHSP